MADTSNLAQVVFKVYSGNIAGEINLKPEAFRLLVQVDGVRTVAEIAQGIGVDQAAAASIAASLYKAGVLEIVSGVVAPPRATVNGVFFDHVTRELTLVIGPVASMLIEDEVSALGETRENFPRNRMAELVERVSGEIRDEQKRVNFQRVMLEAIRKS